MNDKKMVSFKNLTVRGKKDGFGCQLNAKLSGIAFCHNHPHYRYVHTPFTTVSHGYRGEEHVEQVNNFIGIPDNRHGKKIHVVFKFMQKVFNNPNDFYNDQTLDHIRNMYWSGKERKTLDQITVHIRRGDIQRHRRDGGRWRRFQPNQWYNHIIPSIANTYSDSYKIVIHSEGDIDEFEPITNGWSPELRDRTFFKLGDLNNEAGCENNMLHAFHEMISSKVLVQSKSGLSYTAGLYNENHVHFVRGNPARGQKIPLNNWIVINPK
jgi:hypothetical protein